MKLQDLAREIEAELTGDGSIDVTSAATLEDAQPGQLSFLSNPKYASQLSTTKASAVVVAPNVKADGVALLKAKDPYYAFRQAVVRLHGFRKHPFTGVHPKAHVDPAATVGEGTLVYPGVFIGPRAKIGRDCILYANVVVYDDCVLGDRVTLHSGTVVGQDGFGYATVQGVHHKIPQTGNVIIEDDVEIGANCAIDRATLGSTVIGMGTKMGNLMDIGHGSKIGPYCLFVGQVGVAGSVTIGHHVVMAGQVGIAGHLKIGDLVTIGAQAGVIADIPEKSTVVGAPAMPAQQARRVYSIFTQLPELVERVKELEKKAEPQGG
jgi:UDP-3-O-[3-hydroxymyristoyl] glucosamine N-acyltransferase